MTDTCETCKGKRTVDCSECDGAGYFEKRCANCNDTDYVGGGGFGCNCQNTDDEDCDCCNGDGFYECSECEGEGKIEE